jgi:hypothetical protein
MFGISSALVFAAIWLQLYGNIGAHYERLQHVPQYEIPPEIGNQDDIYNELVGFLIITIVNGVSS